MPMSSAPGKTRAWVHAHATNASRSASAGGELCFDAVEDGVDGVAVVDEVVEEDFAGPAAGDRVSDAGDTLAVPEALVDLGDVGELDGRVAGGGERIAVEAVLAAGVVEGPDQH